MLPSILHMASSHSIGFHRHFDFITVDVLWIGSEPPCSPTTLHVLSALLVRDESGAQARSA
jgi:hypothetical protein